MRLALIGVVGVLAHVSVACSGSPTAPSASPSIATPPPVLTDAQQVAQIARQFIEDFSNSTLDANYVLRNLHPTCDGREGEERDITFNRATRLMLGAHLGVPDVTVSPNMVCAVRHAHGDACAYSQVATVRTARDRQPRTAAIGDDRVNDHLKSRREDLDPPPRGAMSHGHAREELDMGARSAGNAAPLTGT